MSPTVQAQGRCYCGAVEFEVEIPMGATPVFTAYCHCDSCRRAHAAPLYHVACVQRSMFDITKGEGEIREFQKPGGRIVRAFCGVCGSKVRNTFPGWQPGGHDVVAFFPDLLEEGSDAMRETLRPRKHNRPEECVLDFEILAELTEDR